MASRTNFLFNDSDSRAKPSSPISTISPTRPPPPATSLSPSSSISVRMANPSSSHHHDRERRERGDRERSHHHHRTISSTTLLLTLSLILAVLAVMLSLPSSSSSRTPPTTTDPDPANSGLWGYLTPKRSQALVSREGSVAVREAEVARREAELLAGAPGGVVATPTAITCPICPTITETIETFRAPLPVQTIYREVHKDDVAPPGWANDIDHRIKEILDRESKIADREKDIGRREEAVNRREHDAARRESWIMEQLISLGNEPAPQTVEEEYIYEPSGAKRKLKALPNVDASPKTVTHTHYHPEPASTTTQTVTVPAPASTRVAAHPLPQSFSSSSAPVTGPTKVVEIVVDEDVPDDTQPEEDDEDVPRTVTIRRKGRPATRPKGWFGGRW